MIFIKVAGKAIYQRIDNDKNLTLAVTILLKGNTADSGDCPPAIRNAVDILTT